MLPMFKKILIANRGEIACRVAATARRLAVRTVAVYSDADRNAKHVRVCDEAIHIGGSSPKDSYLVGSKIIAAAQSTGAQAIHPGYGFLSENDEFAQACLDAGLVFIGPPPAAIRAMGLKSQAKSLMGRAGVPLVPGYHGDNQDAAFLLEEAARIGYPVLIKASAGGGGKGMRVVARAEDFEAALRSCQREAANSFGDPAVLIERYVQKPRHIEIQVFADTQGHCVSLFERDCSVQRRHQKVLEESPAPGLSAQTRQAMGAAAVAAAQAVGYVGAGTVEFIAEPDVHGGLRFFFMEMNTRLQVEHPVTESITGIDLVEWQLLVAAGRPLPRTQGELQIRGHAIEARICAENPDAQFLPATGRLDVLRTPAGALGFERADVRFDSGVEQGDAISPFYDSMIAKLIVWGVDREQALRRMDTALMQTHIVGLHTNVEFLRRVINSTSFATADLDTALIERERAVLFDRPGLSPRWAVAALVAHQAAALQRAVDADPWSRTQGWRLQGRATRHFEVDMAGTRQAVAVGHDGEDWTVAFMGDRSVVRARPLSLLDHEVTLDGHCQTLSVYVNGERCAVFGPQGGTVIRWVRSVDSGPVASHSEAGLRAPMPGKVVAFHVRAGDRVTRGQIVAVMEAMKMEHSVAAPRDGQVQCLSYGVGDQVDEGAELLTLVAGP